MRPNPAERLPIDRLLLILLIVATFLFGVFGSTQFLYTLPVLNAGLSTMYSAINQLETVGTVVSVAVTLMIGILLSRLGYNWVFLLGAALSAAGIGVSLLPWSIPLMLIGSGAFSAGTILISSSASLYLLIHGRRRLIVWLVVVGTAGQFIGTQLTAFTGYAASKRELPTEIFSLVTVGAGVLFIAFVLTRLRWRTNMASGEAIWYYNPFQTLRDSRAWPILVITVTTAIISNLLADWYTYLLRQMDGYPNQLAIWMSIGSVSIIISMGMWGWLVGQFNASRLVLIGLGGVLVGASLLWLSPSPLSYSVMSFFLAALAPVVLLHALDRAGINHLPALMGLNVLVSSILYWPAQSVMNTLMTSDIFTRPLSPLVIVVTMLVLLAGGALWWSQREAIPAKNSVAMNNPDDIDPVTDYVVETFPTTLDHKQNYGSPEQNP